MMLVTFHSCEAFLILPALRAGMPESQPAKDDGAEQKAVDIHETC